MMRHATHPLLALLLLAAGACSTAPVVAADLVVASDGATDLGLTPPDLPVAPDLGPLPSDGGIDGGPGPDRPVTAPDGALDGPPDTDVLVPADGPGPDGPGPDGGTDGLLSGLSGSCGVIAPLLDSPDPSLVENAVAFDASQMYVRSVLSPGGQRLFDTPNAGGSSGESEVMSYEVLRVCDDALLLKTETEIGYAPPDGSGSNVMTDILMEIEGQKVGVSVTRAYRREPMVLDDQAALTQLEDKLTDIIRSSERVLPEDRWVKQILHVFVSNAAAADTVARVWPMIDLGIRADTIVLVTETSGGGFIYCQPDPPLGSECPPLP